MMYLVLLIGFALLIKGADWFVDGAADIARRFHIPSVIIGLTIVALGTSLPELSVSLNAAVQGRNALAVSNVLGSNMFNTLVVVGCSALIRPFIMDDEVRQRDVWFNLGAVALLLVLICITGSLTRLDGLVLLAFLVCYILILVRAVQKDRSAAESEEGQDAAPLWKSLLLIGVGALGIGFGGLWTVDAATDIAYSWGWSEALVGLTIVSIGTSLPELVTSVVAARKGESGLSIGNALGSNIMNIGFILGMSSAIHPIAVVDANFIDMFVLLAVAIVFVVLAKTSDKMDRKRGTLLLAIYIVYFVYILLR